MIRNSELLHPNSFRSSLHKETQVVLPIFVESCLLCNDTYLSVMISGSLYNFPSSSFIICVRDSFIQFVGGRQQKELLPASTVWSTLNLTPDNTSTTLTAGQQEPTVRPSECSGLRAIRVCSNKNGSVSIFLFVCLLAFTESNTFFSFIVIKPSKIYCGKKALKLLKTISALTSWRNMAVARRDPSDQIFSSRNMGMLVKAKRNL